MADFNSPRNEVEPQLGVDEVVEYIFGKQSNTFRQLIAARELVARDCALNQGRGTLWPVTISGGIATATGPDAKTLDFQISEDADASRLTLADPDGPYVPLCLWEGTLVPGNWEPVTSDSLPLPGAWQNRTVRQKYELSLSTKGKRHNLNVNAVMEAEMGFVATSSESAGERRYSLQVYASPRFTGPAVVVLRFLDRDGRPLPKMQPSGVRNPRVQPQLIEFRQPSDGPQSDQERRMIGALGGAVVSASCQWRIPRNLSLANRCRITVRPVTPAEALQFASTVEPIPFVSNKHGHYSATRRRSGVALGNNISSKHGLLLSVVRKRDLLLQLNDRLRQQGARDGRNVGGKSGKKDGESDEEISELTDVYLEAMIRGADCPVLQAGEWDDEKERYLHKMYWNRFRTNLSRNKRIHVEADLGEDYRLDKSDVCSSVGSAEARRREGHIERLRELVEILDYETYEELQIVVSDHLRSSVKKESWHNKLVDALLDCEWEIKELAHLVKKKDETVKKARQRILAKVRKQLIE